LRGRLAIAEFQSAKHKEAFQSFKVSQVLRDQWLTMILAWEADHSQPNPYIITTEGLHLH
jgi:hypothetical protein